jgi:hypothetical protein
MENAASGFGRLAAIFFGGEKTPAPRVRITSNYRDSQSKVEQGILKAIADGNFSV